MASGPSQSSEKANPGGSIVRRQTQDTRQDDTVGSYPQPFSRVTTAVSRQSFHFRKAATLILQPEKKVGPPPSILQSLKAILKTSWLNVLLVCIPVSWALHFTHQNPTLVFIFSFVSIIPLAKLLALATEELSIRVGQTLAGLLNATLGNAVELIISIIALTKCELQLVQASLVGSILSNLLLVLGMCFFAGGTRFSEQGFSISASQLNGSLLTLSVIAVLLPAAFEFAIGSSSKLTPSDVQKDILSLSHGVAIILLFIYGSYLVFQLSTHANLYTDANIPKSITYAKRKPESTSVAQTATTSSEPGPTSDEEALHETHEEEDEELPQMTLWMTLALLGFVTVLVAVTAEWLVDSVDGLTSSGKISKEFVGIILLPIVGNAAEHVTAVTVSVKDKITLSLGVAVGSSIQIALFVIPFIVTLGWILNKPLTLLFDPYESIVLFLAVLTVNNCVQDGKSNWLEGMILMSLYLILGVTFWFYPGSGIPQCS